MADLLPVAQRGDRLASLEALRDRLAREIDQTVSARDVAALSQRFMDVVADIADLTKDEGEDPIADLIALPGGAG